MTASESLQLYQLLFKLTNNETQAKSIVTEIERTVDTKFEKEEQRFVPKNEFEKIDFKIELLRQEMKTAISDLRGEMRGETNKLIVWLVATIFASITIAKYILH